MPDTQQSRRDGEQKELPDDRVVEFILNKRSNRPVRILARAMRRRAGHCLAAAARDPYCLTGTNEEMTIAPNILALVLAGGEGTRLHPLTQHRSKPSVPFGGRFRIVDFVLSNLVNSKIFAIYLLVQYKSQSLIEHIRRSWVLAPIFPEQFIAVVPPQMREGPEWFQGTSDAVYQNLGLIEKRSPDLVVVFGADHLYRMDVRQMVAFHLQHAADVTIAALPVPIGMASAFGIIDAGGDGAVRAFREKPPDPTPMAGDPTRAFASMGNYIFTTEVLSAALREGHRLGEKDFGKDLLPRLIQTKRVFAYDFSGNRVPGTRDYEERGYWRDVGTIDAYFAAHQDLLGAEPKFDMFNPKWRIGSSNYQGPSPKFVHAEVDNSIISSGGLIRGARVRNSIVRREVLMEDDVELDECIVMDYAVLRKGVRLRRVIVDRYNTINAGERIGYDMDADRRRFTVTDSGIVVVPRGVGTDTRAEEMAFRYL
jgi:glucose-1-phosphate adenylyltransferase